MNDKIKQTNKPKASGEMNGNAKDIQENGSRTEKEIEEKILASAETEPIPESLLPENIAKKLKENGGSSARHSSQLPKHRSARFRHMAEAAAAIALAVVVGGVTLRWTGQQKELSDSTVGMGTGLLEETAEREKADVDEDENIDRSRKEHASEAGELYHLAADYDEVYDVIPLTDYIFYEWEKEEARSDIAATAEADTVSGASAEADVAADLAEGIQDLSAENDFSTTNLQEYGVDESDIVKTDGNYIYVVRERQVQIVKISDGNMKTAGMIRPEMAAADSLEELYVDGDRLYLVISCVDTEMSSDTDDALVDFYSVSSDDSVKLLTYDISDPARAELLGTVTQDGYYYTSRKVGNYVYIFSWKDLYGYTEDTIKNAIPSVQGIKVSADCIYIPEEATSELIITSVDGNEPDRTTDQIVVMNSGASIYMGTQGIYLYNSRYDSSQSNTVYTEIAKFSYKDGYLDGVGAASVVGSVEDTFAISEKNDYLRVLTTDWYSSERTNLLYVLDENLSLCGEIRDIATGESIYAARYLGDMAYFITYRNTDPLYVADLSDPQNPQLLGNVEISGFSDYLHPYGDGKMLGIGYETDEDSRPLLGVKLVMFDTEDPAEPKILDTEVLSEMNYTASDAYYKTVMIDAEKNLIGFLTADYDSDVSWYYQVYRWDEGGFREVLVQDLGNEISWGRSGMEVRGVYVGNYFYLVTTEEIKSYAMEDEFSLFAEIALQ